MDYVVRSLLFLNLKPWKRFMMCIILPWYCLPRKSPSGGLIVSWIRSSLGYLLRLFLFREQLLQQGPSTMKRITGSTWKSDGLSFFLSKDLRALYPCISVGLTRQIWIQPGWGKEPFHTGGTWFPLVVQFGNSRRETLPLFLNPFSCSGHLPIPVEKKIITARIEALAYHDELS